MRTLDYAYLGDGEAITLTHRGHKILVYTRDRGLSMWIVMHGMWEPQIEECVRRQLGPNDTVVEVGCNLGYHTLAMADRIGPGGRLYGFEANPELFKLLRATVDLNGFLPFTELHNHAVTDVAGAVQFQFSPSEIGGGNLVTGHPNRSKVLTVKGEPLDHTLAQVPSIRMLRMDAEGAEPLIVKGGLQLIDRSPDMVMIAEWCPPMMAARCDLGEYIGLLAVRGFQAWRIEDDASLAPVPLDALPTHPHGEIAFARSADALR